jgi:hypothetical protein
MPLLSQHHSSALPSLKRYEVESSWTREAREDVKLGRMAVVAKKLLPLPGYARVLVR